MLKHFGTVLVLTCLLGAVSARAGAPQAVTIPDSLRSTGLYRDVEYLSDSICAGRATGTPGCVEAAWYIARRFESDSLDVRVQTFGTKVTDAGAEVPARNILAEIRRPGRSRWIVVTAYYDGLGERAGNVYPGADSNASGVAGLLAIADSLSAGGGLPSYNLLLVALDGHNADLSGARTLWQQTLRKLNVRMVVNLDIIGSSLAPVQPYKPEYVMALGADAYRKQLDAMAQERGLSIYYQYYKSREFTDLFFRRMGDQKVFLDHELPTVMFTSGITMNTNKTSDTPQTLDYDQLSRRIALVVTWLRTL